VKERRVAVTGVVPASEPLRLDEVWRRVACVTREPCELVRRPLQHLVG
jgi:hypothetical protein